MNPAVSFVIPLYNKAQYIVETVKSVLAQSETDWELLIVDNNSTDGGPELVRDQFADARIRMFACAKPGVSSARNSGARETAGKWLVFLDADDLLAPDYLRTQLALSEGMDLVISSYIEFIDGAPEREKIRRPTQGPPSQAALADSAIVFAPGPPHCFLIRRTFLREDLAWPEHLDRVLGEDAVYWFRLVNEARVAFNPQPMVRYRFWTPASRYTTLSDPANMFVGLHLVVTENIQYLEQRGQSWTFGQAETLMRFYAGVYLHARRLGDRVNQKKSLVEASRWQKRYFQTCPRPTLPMRVRRWLGLSLFAWLAGHA